MSGTHAQAHPPRLAPGVELLGEYQGSGLAEPTYLVRNPAGQVAQVSRLLHLVLSGIDGSRTVSQIAVRTSVGYGRTVSAGNVGYLLASKLAPLGLVSGEGETGQAVPDQAVLTLRLRRTLLPAAWVQHVARLFQPLFRPPVVVAALAGLMASDARVARGGRLGPAFQYVLLHPLLLLMVLGLSVVSMVFHECGHAAACRYGGARPGVIGIGFYVMWPAFFTNVTDAYRLGRAGRIRTDLGGVYFNAVFALALAAAYLATGYPPLLAAVVLVHMEVVQQLMPSLRLDGYFILADLIGLPDLFRRIGPTLRSIIPGRPADPRVLELKRAARVTLTAWILLVVPLLAVELVLVLLNAPGMIRTSARSLSTQVRVAAAAFGQGDIPNGLLSVISVIMLALPMAGLSYVFLLTGKRAGRAVVAACRRRPVLWLPSVAVVLLAAAGLAASWGLLPASTSAAPHPAAAGHATPQRPPQARPDQKVSTSRPRTPCASNRRCASAARAAGSTSATRSDSTPLAASSASRASVSPSCRWPKTSTSDTVIPRSAGPGPGNGRTAMTCPPSRTAASAGGPISAASISASTPSGSTCRIRAATPGPRGTTTCAPSSLTSSSSAGLASAITCSPSARPSWIAYPPTAPAAPVTPSA